MLCNTESANISRSAFGVTKAASSAWLRWSPWFSLLPAVLRFFFAFGFFATDRSSFLQIFRYLSIGLGAAVVVSVKIRPFGLRGVAAAGFFLGTGTATGSGEAPKDARYRSSGEKGPLSTFRFWSRTSVGDGVSDGGLGVGRRIAKAKITFVSGQRKQG